MVKCSRETVVLGAKYLRAIEERESLNGPEFGRLVRLLRERSFSDLVAFSEMLDWVKQKYLDRADYVNAARFRELGDNWNVNILEEPEHEMSKFRYFNEI